MQLDLIIYAKEDGVAKIVLNRPDVRNALVPGMREEINAALVDARNDPLVRAIVITGSGRAFCAGGNLATMAAKFTALDARARIQDTDRLILTEIMTLEKPVIAMVNGHAAGAGCSMAIACDIVIASEEAKFVQSFVRIGAIPDVGALYNLPRLLGLHKAKEFIFTGDTIDAREAERIGLVNRVVPATELEATTMELARRLAKGATRAIGMAKSIMHRSLAVDLPSAIELEAMGQAICFQTEDHHEGVKAFFEKRPAEFKGR